MRYSVSLINNYSKKHHKFNVECLMTPDKGRVLHSHRDFTPGEIIFIEPPLIAVQERPGDESFEALKGMIQKGGFDFDPLWYWCALNTTLLSDSPTPGPGKNEKNAQTLNCVTTEKQELFLTLFAPDVDGPSDDVKKILEGLKLKQGFDPLLVEQLLQVWIHNCFEYTDDPVGYSVYFISSFLAHSCLPNAVWHYDAQDNFVLRARTHIKTGEELSVSYLSEDALFEPTPMRQKTLESTKSFICTCIRCTSPLDLCRGFKCPQCKVGTVYLHPSAGTSRDVANHPVTGDVDMSPTANGGKKFAYPQNKPDTTLYAHCTRPYNTCQSCAHTLTDIQRRFLLQQEKKYVGKIKEYGGDPDGEAEDEEGEELVEEESQDEEGAKSEKGRNTNKPTKGKKKLDGSTWFELDCAIRALFTQHWVAMRWAALTHMSRKSVAPVLSKDASHVSVDSLREKINMQKKMFWGENGSIAWGLDELGDQLLHTVNYERGSQTTSLDKTTLSIVKGPAHALETYHEAHRSLLILFGPDHEYTQGVQKKLDNMARQMAAAEAL
eukprot:GDKI01013499.1.p1 GENE.GDKI01013499.1~~GDKI01013499.1.p1  ORF type:complete len:582 (-),score=201.21 GDKI01013499.1:208-1857(-)